jgi:hypothetical protein
MPLERPSLLLMLNPARRVILGRNTVNRRQIINSWNIPMRGDMQKHPGLYNDAIVPCTRLKSERSRLRLALFFGFFFFFPCTFFQGDSVVKPVDHYVYRGNGKFEPVDPYAYLFVPREEIPYRVPAYLVSGFLVGFIFYYLYPKYPKCGRSYDDLSSL